MKIKTIAHKKRLKRLKCQKNRVKGKKIRYSEIKTR